MSFFIRKLNRNLTNSTGKRKLNKKANESKSSKKFKPDDNDEILSDDEVINGTEEPTNDTLIESEEETDQQKKIKAAKRYLSELQDIEKLKKNDEELDHNAINVRLKEDVLKKLGTLYVKLADNVKGVHEDQIRVLKNGHRLSVTSCVVSFDNQFVYSVSKDSMIVKWCAVTGKKLKFVKGKKLKSIKGKKSIKETPENREEVDNNHTSAINSITVSTDNKFLATGCDDNFINIWNPATLEFVHRFKGHSAKITGLIIRKFSHVLYSISKDRSLRVWDLDTMCYVQTLFGHQEVITSIDMLIKERALTAGGFDSTLRLWKIAEETQLIFQGKGESIECVKYIDEQHFISGTMSGSVSLWSAQKKRPLFVREQIHGCDRLTNTPNWICSLATHPFSDLFATGSCDGFIRLWKHTKDKFEEIHKIPLNGFVNSLQFIREGTCLVASIGQEHRLGRWWRIKESKNSVVIIPLKIESSG